MSALEYYLAAFDEDFTKVKRRRSIPIKSPSQQPPADPMAALAASLPRKLPPPPTRKVSGGVKKTQQTGWQDKSLNVGFAVTDKPVEKWTRIDLRRYVAHIYNLRWGDTLSTGGQFALINEIIEKVEHNFRTMIGQEGNPILKEYFDFFVETQVPEAAKERGGMNWRKFSYQKYVLAFVQQWKSKCAAKVVVRKPESDPKPEPVKTAELTIEAVTQAYMKAPGVLIREFGVIVTINYLLMVRKHGLDKALTYVRNAVGKTSPADIKEVIAATERYQPYPKALAFTDAESVLAELFKDNKPTVMLGDNPAFGFMTDIA
jgi:hypothetical protein